MDQARKRDKIKRYVVFVIGLFVNAMGVAMVTKADLGTSPITSIPYVLSLNFPPTIGNFTILFSILLIVLQIFILRKDFKLEHALQIPVSFGFGYMIDFCMWWMSFWRPQIYPMKIASLVLGCIVLGVGVWMEVIANVVMLPGESFVRASSTKLKKEFSSVKICFDVSLAVIATILSFVLAGKLQGVREGTVITALLVGVFARKIGGLLSFVPGKIFLQEEEAAPAKSSDESEQPAYCIAIGREYGSGGHDFGKILAEKLGYEFYDREIIRMAAGSTSYSEDFISDNEEAMSTSKLTEVVREMYSYSPKNATPRDKVFAAESKIIRELADKGNCVIVGRCADYVLRDRKNCLRVFLHAPMQERIRRVMKRENLSESEADRRIMHIDRIRGKYYCYYTGNLWGLAANYTISVDTSLGAEYVEKIVLDALDIIKR